MSVLSLLLLACVAAVVAGYQRATTWTRHSRLVLQMTSIDNKPTAKNRYVEATRVVIKKIPDLNSIRQAANACSRTDESREFCSKTGGYPSHKVKDSIYTVLMAYSSRAITRSQNIYNYQENCKNCEV